VASGYTQICDLEDLPYEKLKFVLCCNGPASD